MAKPQYAGPWQRLRRIVLERDGGVCQIKGPNCTGTATDVDHIRSVEQGGAWFDVDNLRAACRRCNIGRANSERSEAWRQGPPITLVYGPPGAGKSTHVREHATPGDLIIDYDDMARAFGAPDRMQAEAIHNVTNAARNAALTVIRRNEHQAPAVWIVSTNRDAPSMFPHHHLVYLNPGEATAYQRATDGGRTPEALELIGQWQQPSSIW